MRLARLAPLALLVVATGAACVPSNVPTSYDSVAESSFMGSCTGDIPLVGGSTTTTLASEAYCQCAYQVFVANVPYNDQDRKDRGGGQTFANYDGPTYLELDKKLKDDPNALPASVVEKLQQCPRENVTTGTTPGTVPGTTPGTDVGTQPGGAASDPGGAAGTAVSTTAP